jgi:hypothetical protein
VMTAFKIRPIDSAVLSSGIFSGSKMDSSEAEMRKRWSDLHQQTSSLRQGRTSAVVEGADWSKDGRWLAIWTRKRWSGHLHQQTSSLIKLYTLRRIYIVVAVLYIYIIVKIFGR